MQSSIQVGVNGQAVWVKVEGKGTFLNSGDFKQFTREMVNRGYRDFIVDLENCSMMDSTFMGTMAGVALRLKELGQGHLHVVHCGQRSRELLTGLGLDQLFDIQSDGTPAPECGALEHAHDSRQGTTRDMLAAHEALCQVAPQNFSKFKDVLEFLKQDLRQEPAK